MEKLDHPVTVKFRDRSFFELQKLADARGMEVSEYIRHLVDQDRLKARAQFDALSLIFASSAESGQRNEG
jgi:hypothetical protein